MEQSPHDPEFQGSNPGARGKKSLNKIRPQSPIEKLSRNLWSISFAPNYSATGLATRM